MKKTIYKSIFIKSPPVSYRTSGRVGQRERTEKTMLFMQKLIMAHPSATTSENIGLLQYKLDQMMRELQAHHRPFRFIAQCSRAGHTLRKEALSVFYVYLLAFRSQRRDALNWG